MDTEKEDASQDELMDKFYDACDQANAIKFGVSAGEKFLLAFRRGDLARAKEIAALPFERGGNLLMRFLQTDKEENSVLHWAVIRKRKDLLEFALSLGLCGIHAKNKMGKSPLDLASELKRQDLIDLLKTKEDPERPGA